MSDELSFKHYELGRSLMASGKVPDAIIEFERSINYSPHFKTLELLGECYLELGDYRKAVVPLAAATALNDQVRAPSLLAKALLGVGDRHRARELALRVLSVSDENRTAKEVAEATKDLKL